MVEKKDKVKKLDELKQTKPEQLTFFEFIEPATKPYSNSIELYDAIPKYYWGNQVRDEKGRLDDIEKEFKHKGERYSVYVQPARLKAKDGKYKDYLPSKREELVEDALRKLACDGRGVFLDDSAGVIFTLYGLQEELKRMGHGYNLNQIKDAIMICGQASMQVKSEDDKSIVFMPFFETVGLRTQEDWKGHGKKTKAYVKFNFLVTESIKSKTFRLLNYDKSMSYKHVLARWLHKRLSHNYIQASSHNTFSIKLSTIIRDSGVKQYPRISDNIIQLREALEEMKDKEVVLKYEIQNILEGRKIINAKITISPHESFVSDVIYANKRDNEIHEEENREKALKEFKNYTAKLGGGGK